MESQTSYRRDLFILIYLILLDFNPLYAQTAGMPLAKGDIEFGFTVRWYKRNFPSAFANGENYNDWGNDALTLRLGITNRLTASVDGLVYAGSGGRFPSRDYKNYVLGAGLGADLWDLNDTQVMLGAHYQETAHIDRSPDRYDKAEQSFFAGPELRQFVRAGSFPFSAFIAPAFVWDELLEYPGNLMNYTGVALHNFGFAAGLEVLAYEHAHLDVHVVYADFWQPRWSVGYVF